MKKCVLWALCFCLVCTSEIHAEGLLMLWSQIVENNPTLKNTEYTVEHARAQQDQALSKLLPNVSINSTYSLNDLNPNATANGFQPFNGPGNVSYTGFTGGLKITQAIFDLPSYLKLEGAKTVIKQQEQEALAQRMQLAYNMVDQYLSVLEAIDTIAQVQAEQAATDAQAKRTRYMHEHQLAKVVDLYEIEAYAQSLQSSQIEALHNKEIALEKLRELTGVFLQAPDRLIQDHFPEVKRTADDWVQEALSANPMLLSLQYASESAESTINSAKAGHLPIATLNATETYANTNYNNLQSAGAYNIGTLSLNVIIPLYSGGGVEANSREAETKYFMSKEKIEELRRKIEKDTRTAWHNAVAGHSRIESNRQETEFREKAKIAEERSYELGAVTIVEVLDAHKRLLKARSEFFRSRYDFIRSLIRLRLNAGSFADLDLEAIAPWFAGP